MAGKRRSHSHSRGSKASVARWWLLCGSAVVFGVIVGAWSVFAIQRLHSTVHQATLWQAQRGRSLPGVAALNSTAATMSSTGTAIAQLASTSVQNSPPGQAAQATIPAAHGTNIVAQVTSRVDAAAAAVAAAAVSSAASAASGVAQGSTSPAQQQDGQQVQVTVTQLNEQVWRVEPDARSSKGKASSSKAQAAGSGAGASQHAAALGPGRKQPAVTKVALLFLTMGAISNEAVWRAFFQTASQLQLQPAISAAAAAAAQHSSSASIEDAIGRGKALHPNKDALPAWVYPGYRIQHGLAAGAAMPARWQQQQQDLQHAQQQGHATQPGSTRTSANNFPAAGWEAELLKTEAARLASASAAALSAAWPGTSSRRKSIRDHTPSAKSFASRASTAAAAPHQHQQQDSQPAANSSSNRQAQPQQVAWNAYTQPSTMKEAMSAAGLLPVAAQAGQNTSAIRGAAHYAAQQIKVQDMRIAPAQCLASVGHAAGRSAMQLHSAAPPQLFSVYVHTPAGLLLPPNSIFSGCELSMRLNTTRGYAQHVLAEAEALLLYAALADPLNTKFVLVSDSSIPLYPPQVIWAQLMSEQHSRLDACITPGRDIQLSRWHGLMATPQFGPQHWRKSSQWFTLTRPHAMLAVADSHVREMLHRYCYTNLTRQYPICVSDEHWLPSLLASYGLDSQNDCEGLTHYADWRGGWHPHTFDRADQLTPPLVQLMRTGTPSRVAAAAAELHVVAAANSTAWQQATAATAAATLAAAAARCNAGRALETGYAIFAPAKPDGRHVFVRGSKTSAAQERGSYVQVGTAGSGNAGSSGGGGGEIPPAQAAMEGLRTALLAAGYAPLGQTCPLLARKFPGAIENNTLVMALSCAGLSLGSWCQGKHGSAGST